MRYVLEVVVLHSHRNILPEADVHCSKDLHHVSEMVRYEITTATISPPMEPYLYTVVFIHVKGLELYSYRLTGRHTHLIFTGHRLLIDMR